MIQNAEKKNNFIAAETNGDFENELVSPELLDDSLDFEEEDLEKLPI